MTVKITWYGHACFLLETAGAKIMIDPFLSGNSLAPISSSEAAADYLLISHGHGDHLGDAVAIARRTGATVIANFEISDWFKKQGVGNIHPMHIGGGFDYPWGRVKLTIAHHGSVLPDGSCGGNPCGFLLSMAGKNIYHAGDTGLFYDMKLIGEEGLDLAILPIGDNFTMGPADALRAVKLLEATRVVPAHYNTFELIRQDPYAWGAKVERETATKVTVLEPGGTMHL